MIKKKIKKNRGFVLLFVVMLSSIILAITLGVADISLKEIKFSTSARDTNEAFFAADTGAECALFYDKSTVNAFINPSPSTIICNGNTVRLNGSDPSWNFVVSGLGSEGKGCAEVAVDKSDSGSICNSPTCIVSKGYNDCNIPNSGRVERQLELSY